ncbi:EAL domain-containing protein [Pseudomonas nunensis]|uniref:EAL domain-containing protein n=1 Tax=Pseudomonas nunensis TaxID=2961896 RepID=A0ABY5EKB3_9PSED|nr:EAL domain-containing protein [Pseudomonas nunensis]KPN89889.1 diguanylate cyclase [Pseudomonas nunensis]UTO16114.1 EAL domain-containing protein [Pseudomonas nunensis]
MESMTLDVTSRLVRWLLPQSLRAQFTLAFLTLALLILAGGATAVYALRTSNNATRQLTDERLVRMQNGQDMLQRTLLIERQTDQLLTTRSPDALRSSYAATVEQLEALDQLVQQLTAANSGVAILDMYQSSQMFRNTANIVAQLRESLLQTEVTFEQTVEEHTARLTATQTRASLELAVLLFDLPQALDSDAVQRLRIRYERLSRTAGQLPDADLETPDLFTLRLNLINQQNVIQRFNEELKNEAGVLVAVARAQSSAYTEDYREAVQRLVEASNLSQQWVLIMLGASLVFAWFVTRVFMGRHVLMRLNEISRQLRQEHTDKTHLMMAVHGKDEIGNMARAVNQFLQDRLQLEKRTVQLSIATKRLAVQNSRLEQEAIIRAGQGHVLELIARSTELSEVLDSLAHLVESQLEGMMVSILVLDEDGKHLLHGAAPSLPQAYNQLIDGIAIGPKVGSCGTAVYRREPVIVTDIEQDPLWEEYRSVAASYGFRACWSTPILSHERNVLGTFALYSNTVRSPRSSETRLINMATPLAGIAIERQLTEKRIRYMGDHDALTGLPNRTLLEDRLKQAILYAQRYNRLVTVVFLDLDKFKLVNDSLGHSAGDELLKTVAQRMLECVRRTDTVVRLGGDEFVIILFDQPSDIDGVTPALHKIQEAILRPIQISGHTLHVTCSMGLATYPADGNDTDTLLSNADAAMYRAKELGRNSYQFYTSEMNNKVQGKLAMQDGLRNALNHNEFLLLYQPQVDLQSGQIIGVEALIRWQHPELGMVSPIKFIPQAEETGLIVPIGDWVIHAACRQNKAWQDAGCPPITMSVNISARQFIERNLIDRVRHALQETGLDPKYLELELTESLIMQDLQQAISKMKELQSMGISLSIDDFGTGYSSLAALKSFPIARLKIDQSFVRDLPDNENDKAIATAVISLGHKLNLKVIAEGVETEEQQTFLRENGCDEIQGHFFSRAVSAEDISLLLRTPRLPQSSRIVGSGAVSRERDVKRPGGPMARR